MQSVYNFKRHYDLDAFFGAVKKPSMPASTLALSNFPKRNHNHGWQKAWRSLLANQSSKHCSKNSMAISSLTSKCNVHRRLLARSKVRTNRRTLKNSRPNLTMYFGNHERWVREIWDSLLHLGIQCHCIHL